MDCSRRAGARVGILGDPVPRLTREEVQERADEAERAREEAHFDGNLEVADSAERKRDHYRGRLADWGKRPPRGKR